MGCNYEFEDQVNDRISFIWFVGIVMDGTVPDHSLISRFRTALTKKKLDVWEVELDLLISTN